MAWERRYYYRVRKVNGRVQRQYVGTGLVAEIAAMRDAEDRQRRQAEAARVRQMKSELDALDADLEAMAEATKLAARVAMLAAGFHQHRRGEWRKRRVKDGAVAHGIAQQCRGSPVAGEES